MGFEQNYERAIGDPRWRAPLKMLTQGDGHASLCGAIEKALCASGRNGAMDKIDCLAAVFQQVYQKGSTLHHSQRSLSDDEIRALRDEFAAASTLLTCNMLDRGTADLFCSAAIDELARCAGDAKRWRRDPRVAVEHVMEDMLRDYASAQMAPAVPTACRKRRESPAAVEIHLSLALGDVTALDELYRMDVGAYRLQKVLPGTESAGVLSQLLRLSGLDWRQREELLRADAQISGVLEESLPRHLLRLYSRYAAECTAIRRHIPALSSLMEHQQRDHVSQPIEGTTSVPI